MTPFILYTTNHTRQGSHCTVCRRALGYRNTTGTCLECRTAARANNVRTCECGKRIVIHKGKAYSQCWKCRQPKAAKPGRRVKYGKDYTGDEKFMLGIANVPPNPFKEIEDAIRKAR